MARTPKNEADRAVHVTVSVPKNLKDRMSAFNKTTNWSAVAKDAFELEVAKLEAAPKAEPVPVPATEAVENPVAEVAAEPVPQEVPVETAAVPAVAVDVDTEAVEAPVVEETPAAPAAVDVPAAPAVEPAVPHAHPHKHAHAHAAHAADEAKKAE